MFTVFFLSFLIVITTVPFSKILINDNQNTFYSYSKELIFGIVFLTFIALLLNFFIELNIYVTSTVLLISLTFLIKFRNCYFNKKFIIFSILQSIFITILILESNVYRPDAGLYHLPYIGILNSEKILIGVSNIHFRYGHTSIIQYLSAIHNNLINLDNGIVFAQALVASSVTLSFLYQLKIYSEKQYYDFHFYYLLFTSIYIAYKMNRYSEYGNDAPAHFLFFYLISELIIFRKNFSNKEYLNQLILTFFIISNKITLIPILVFNLIGLKKLNIKKFFFNKKFFFLVIFLFIWFFKNILTSGCLIYPIKQLCFDGLLWTDLNTIEKVGISSEAWTKGISDINNNNILEKEFIKKFNWIEAWLSKHFLYILKILFPYLLFLFVIFFILSYYKEKKLAKTESVYLIYIILSFITILFWFFKAPLYRYGYSLIIVFISLAATHAAFRFSYKLSFMNKFSKIIIFLCISTIFSKNVIRIANNDNSYFNYPWPKFYSMSKNNYKSSNRNLSLNGVNFSEPKKGGYCMYSKSICAHYGLNDNLDVMRKNNYLIIYSK